MQWIRHILGLNPPNGVTGVISFPYIARARIVPQVPVGSRIDLELRRFVMRVENGIVKEWRIDPGDPGDAFPGM